MTCYSHRIEVLCQLQPVAVNKYPVIARVWKGTRYQDAFLWLLKSNRSIVQQENPSITRYDSVITFKDCHQRSFHIMLAYQGPLSDHRNEPK